MQRYCIYVLIFCIFVTVINQSKIIFMKKLMYLFVAGIMFAFTACSGEKKPAQENEEVVVEEAVEAVVEDAAVAEEATAEEATAEEATAEETDTE